MGELLAGAPAYPGSVACSTDEAQPMAIAISPNTTATTGRLLLTLRVVMALFPRLDYPMLRHRAWVGLPRGRREFTLV